MKIFYRRTGWLQSPSFPEYEVSAYGEVRKIGKTTPMVPHTDRGGYHTVTIGRKTRKVHRLVLEAYHGPQPFDGAVCRHLDGVPANNHFSNLRWGTPSENTLDKWRHGRGNPDRPRDEQGRFL